MSITLESNTNTSTHELIIVRFVPPFVAWQSQPAGLSACKPWCKSFLLLHTSFITFIALLVTCSYTVNYAYRCSCA